MLFKKYYLLGKKKQCIIFGKYQKLLALKPETRGNLNGRNET